MVRLCLELKFGKGLGKSIRVKTKMLAQPLGKIQNTIQRPSQALLKQIHAMVTMSHLHNHQEMESLLSTFFHFHEVLKTLEKKRKMYYLFTLDTHYLSTVLYASVWFLVCRSWRPNGKADKKV